MFVQLNKYICNFKVVRYSIAIIVVFSIFSSCSLIIGKVFYGVRTPKVETEESLITYLKKNKLLTDNVYCVPAQEFNEVLSLSKNKIPDVFIFNQNKDYLPYGEEWACNASVFDFIKNLNDTTVYQTSNVVSLDVMLAKFRNLDGTEVLEETVENIKNKKFIVVAFWSKWAGKLNKTKVREWEQQAKNNNNTEIVFVKLNMDIQKWWNLESKNIKNKNTKNK